MKIRLPLLIVVGFFLCTTVSSQDIHFSNYSYSPLLLSPAKTGAFAGSYRFGANVREQFRSFIEAPYQTLMAFADMPIAFGLKPHHWIGAGINVYTDRSGDLNFKNSGADLSLAYHYAIDPKYKTVITLGLQFGMSKLGIDNENYRSAETLKGNSADPDLALIENFNPAVSDFNIGLSFKRYTSKTSFLDIGIATHHLLQSAYTFTGSTIQNPVARRLNFYAEYHIQSTKQLAIKPLLAYSRMMKFQNLFGQVNLAYQPNKKSSTLFRGGIGYRVGDAVQFLAGIRYKGWDIGAAFDLTVSTASKFNNGYGGLEIGIKKIIVTNKRPKHVPVLLCPRY